VSIDTAVKGNQSFRRENSLWIKKLLNEFFAILEAA
jgi:hypothetical protein